MLAEGRHFSKLAPNVVVKVPMSEVGLEAIARLAAEDIKTNCTLIFSSNQGLLAAKAGASLLSPFVGRLDDINQDGMEVVRELVAMVETYELDAEVLAASIRHPAPCDRGRAGWIATSPRCRSRSCVRWSIIRLPMPASSSSARTGRRRNRRLKATSAVGLQPVAR